MAERITAWKSTDGTFHDNEISAARADFRHLLLNYMGEYKPDQEYIFDPMIEKLWRHRAELYDFLANFFHAEVKS
jgi:hypothetical protein